MVFNLQTSQFGELTVDKRSALSRELGCSNTIPMIPEELSKLKYMKCTFPGHEVYESIIPFKSVFESIKESLEFAEKYMSPLTIKYNYAHKARSIEVMQKLQSSYTTMLQFKKTFINACKSMYWDETPLEWLEVYFLPVFDELYQYMKAIKKAQKENDWRPRPLQHSIIEHPDTIK